MALSLTCRRCEQIVTGENEDELVTAVQAHAATHGHGPGLGHRFGPGPSREHVLRRLRQQAADQDTPDSPDRG